MQKKLQNILLATDFSEPSDTALRVAIKLCKQNGAVLHLLHVVESRYLVANLHDGVSVQQMVREIDNESREKLYHLYETILRTTSIPVQLHMPKGVPYDEICKAAEEMPVDLIVLGTHGASGVREFFIGTTAYSVIKNTVKPVLTIPSGFSKDVFGKILFPVRTVPGIKEKFEYIKPILNHANDATVHLAAITEKGEEAALLEHKDALHEILLYLRQQQISFTNEMYTCTNMASKVLEIAEKKECDLVVINATLDYKWTQFFVGPFTQQIVNRAQVPVLSYRMSVNVNAELKKHAEYQVAEKPSGL